MTGQGLVRGLTRMMTGAVRLYQILVAPLLPPSCRFHPHCSRYAIEALEVHGPARGLFLALGRICRCHPFHPGGLDPVPAANPGDFRKEGILPAEGGMP